MVATLSQPAQALQISGTSTPATCGSSNGAIDLTVSGGTAPYTYNWSGGAAAVQDPANLSPGTYSVEVTDMNGCSVNTTISVNTPSGLAAQVNATPASCNGNTDGGIDIEVTGGLAPYTFVWSQASNNGNEDLTNVGAGTYTVTVTDNDGCTVVASGIVSEPPTLSTSISASEASCGGSDGSISLLVNGGTTPYQFQWSEATLNGLQSPNGLAPGNYSVTVTDANGCNSIANTTVSVPNGPSASMSFVPVDCNGSSTGSIDLSVNGGTAPYTYNWSNGLPAIEDQAVVPAGTYFVTVTDNNNCVANGTVTITEPQEISLSLATSAVSCYGGNDGSATVIATGGTLPYTYSWCDGTNTSMANGLSAGNCEVTVTDANGCSAVEQVVIAAPAILEASYTTIGVSCFGADDGGIDLTISGGSGNYTYSWTGGLPAMEDPQNIATGSYSVLITDQNGCTTALNDIIIDEPTALSLNYTTQEASCNAANGSIDLSVSGGSGVYFYNWSNGLPAVEDPFSLTSGNYAVTVTDGNGCTAAIAIPVTEPAALSITGQVTSVNCFNQADGSIDVTVSGGQAPYTYAWNNLATTEDLQQLSAGNYSLIVTDANNCTITYDAVLDQPSEIVLSGTTTDALCGQNNGSIDLLVNGGIAPYTYQWSNGVPAQEDPIDLGAGTYDVTVTDAQGCSATSFLTVNTPNQLQAIAMVQDAQCAGTNTGSIDLDVSGGIAPFTFVWSGGLGTDEDPDNVAAGTYTVIVTDATGCSILANAQINEPVSLTLNATMASEASCGNANGAIDLEVNGGVAPYSFSWDNGGTSEDIDGLFPGNYTVTVIDANNCIAQSSVVVTTPAELSLSAQSFDASCHTGDDGSIDLSVTGGVPPYNYAWSNAADGQDINGLTAGAYSVLVSDANGCTAELSETVNEPLPLEVFSLNPVHVSCSNGNNGGITLEVNGGVPGYTFDWNIDAFDGEQNPQNLTAGLYQVEVTDANGCNNSLSIQIEEPTPIILTTSSQATSCNGTADGSIDLEIEGGTSPYTISWNNGVYTTEDISALSAGLYSVEVTDANACTETTSLIVEEPAAIVLEAVINTDYNGFAVSCSDANDGEVSIAATGGVAPYYYTWSNGTIGAEASELAAGVYQFVVQDAEGCASEGQVELNSPDPIDADLLIADPNCYGDRNGSIKVAQVDGGTAPFLYALEGGSYSALDSFRLLEAGNYELAIQDANGCEWSETITINDPAELIVDLGADQDIELGDSLQLEPYTNAPNFTIDTFMWNQSTELDYAPWVKPLETSTYSIVVIDENGCVAIDEIEVRVKKERPIYFPNTFSPNDDGLNDYFVAYPGKSVQTIAKFQVFNRWGDLIYQRKDYMPSGESDGWDGRFRGKALNPGVFIFSAEVIYLDGRVEMVTGDITLMR